MNILVNGEPASHVEVSDRGFQYGDGIFTTLPVRQGIPLFFTRHLARLERDGQRLFLPVPEREVLIRDARRLCESKLDGVLKILLTRGSGGRGYRCPEPAVGTRVLSLHPSPDYPPELHETGVAVRVCHTRLGINPSLAGIKHLNRLEQILARAEWPLGEIREGLMLDAEGYVIEGTMTNLFHVRSGVLHTPRLEGCGVAGVMRGLVLEAAAELGYSVEERRIGLEDLYTAEELFLTNSVIGVWPIRRLEQRDFVPSPITRQVNQWIAARIREELAHSCIT